MNEYEKAHRQYQCLDCGEVPIQNGVCPHGCPNGGNPMRLTYNFTNGDFIVYPHEAEKVVLYGRFYDEDTGEYNPPFIRENDSWATYNVADWNGNDLAHFGSLNKNEQVRFMETLKEVGGSA